MTTKMYTFHPLSNMFPRMSDEEFKALVEDIRVNGVRQPLMLYLGQILDGRHRYDAANQAKRDLTERDFIEFKPTGVDTALKFVVSQNVNRRHLNESQRAIIAASIANLEKGANQHTAGDGSIDLPSAAKMLNVGEASVKRARNVLTNAAPELVEQVKQGKLRVSAINKKVLAKPKAEQGAEVKRLANLKSAEPDASDAYDKAQKKLIEKLKKLTPPDAAEAKVERDCCEDDKSTSRGGLNPVGHRERGVGGWSLVGPALSFCPAIPSACPWEARWRVFRASGLVG
jgi:ParB-like chromosome segregation protein Spo0J